MKNNHPVLVLLAITVLTIEAAVLLLRAALVPLVALALTMKVEVTLSRLLLCGRPASGCNNPPSIAPEAPLARPQPHPLAALAHDLQLLPVTQLRAMAGTRSKTTRKAQLIEQVIACS